MALSGHLSKILLRATTRPCFTVHAPALRHCRYPSATTRPPPCCSGHSPIIINLSLPFPCSNSLLPRNAIDSSLFKQWLHNLQSEIGILADGTLALRQVLIQVPGIVFARGPAVTMLILLESDGETYAVLTEQARVPTGRIILELPAGMTAPEELAKG
ncbi:nudix hydrolase 14, chloroplastic-like isoform X2 [Arachis stenosperma]|nr:nudix hydrolase 14, chloroplastic-like isoform X2 [Arachis stenosperma]